MKSRKSGLHAACLGELRRLQLLERAFDPSTQKRLKSLGLGKGDICLEAGAGAGSIARWMSARVGKGGKVIAVDKNRNLFVGCKSAHLLFKQADITQDISVLGLFDFAHARFVLSHIRHCTRAIDNMIKVMKPGGWVFFEEFDFSRARCGRPHSQEGRSFCRVIKALLALRKEKGLYKTNVRAIPRFLKRKGVRNIRQQSFLPRVRGGSYIARLMRLSVLLSEEMLLKTGVVSKADVEVFLRFTEDVHQRAVYFSVYSVWGRVAGK